MPRCAIWHAFWSPLLTHQIQENLPSSLVSPSVSMPDSPYGDVLPSKSPAHKKQRTLAGFSPRKLRLTLGRLFFSGSTTALSSDTTLSIPPLPACKNNAHIISFPSTSTTHKPANAGSQSSVHNNNSPRPLLDPQLIDPALCMLNNPQDVPFPFKNQDIDNSLLYHPSRKCVAAPTVIAVQNALKDLVEIISPRRKSGIGHKDPHHDALLRSRLTSMKIFMWKYADTALLTYAKWVPSSEAAANNLQHGYNHAQKL